MKFGSAVKAAEVLGISQPMVSRLLADLEGRVGFKLFDRRRNHLGATQEAQRFYVDAVRTLDAMRNLEIEARAIANGLSGELFVAAQPVYVDCLLPGVVARFRETRPEVRVKLLDLRMEALLPLIGGRGCDLAIGVTLDPRPYQAQSIALGASDAVCVLPASHPLAARDEVSLEDLREENFVDLLPGSPLRTQIDFALLAAGVNRKTVAETQSLLTQCRLVQLGVGVALTDPMVKTLIAGPDILFKPLTVKISWGLALYLPNDRPMSLLEEGFFSCLREELKTLSVLV